MNDKQIPSQISKAINPSMHVSMGQGPPSGGHNTTNRYASFNFGGAGGGDGGSADGGGGGGGGDSTSKDANDTNCVSMLALVVKLLEICRWSDNDGMLVVYYTLEV